MEKDKNSFKQSKNDVTQSKIRAGKDVHIGDKTNTYYIYNYSIFRILLITLIPLGLSVLYLKNNFEKSEKSIQKENTKKTIDKNEDIESPAIDNKTRSANQIKKITEAKKTNNKKSLEKTNKIIKLSFSNTDEKIKQYAFNSILIEAKKQGKVILKSKDNIVPKDRLICEIQVQKKEVEIGIRTALQISFIIKFSHFLETEGDFITYYIQESEKYLIYEEGEISNILKKWITDLNGKYLTPELFKK